MAVYPLQSSNVFSYTFAGQLGQGTSYLQASNNNPIFNIGGQSWTIECWFKPVGVGYRSADASPYGVIFSKRLGATTTASYFGYIQSGTNRISFYNGTEYPSQTILTPNTWNHIAWVFNQGANVRIFVNGSNVMTTTAVTSIVNNESRFYIGKSDGQNTQLVGDISNFRITLGQALYSGESFNVSTYPVQLPNNAVGSHADGANVAASLTGNVILLTCNDQIIKTNGNTLIDGFTSVGFVHPHAVDTTELQNFSYFFPGNSNSNGQNGTVLVTNTTNSLNLNTDFTIETWFYPTTNTGVLLERGYGGVGNNNASYILIWDTPNNNINFAVANSNTAAYSLGSLTGEAGSLGSPSINAWNHIAVTRAGNTYRGFLNGTLTFTPGTNANTPYAALGRGLTIGGMFRNGQAYAAGIPANTISGYISNLRIIRGRSIYNAAFTPSTTQLSNITNTILLTALTPNLEDLSGAHGVRANGMSEIKFSTESPFTANAIANTDETTLSTLNNATGRRQERIYDKLDTAEFTMSGPIFPELGRRQERIYDKLDIAEYITSVPLYDALGGRQNRIYNKFDKAIYAYIPIGTGDGTGGGSANIEYEFWS